MYMRICALLLVAGLSSTLATHPERGFDTQKATYDAQSIADLFYALNGDSTQPHKKLNHFSGFCAMGSFHPARDITKHFNIPLLAQASIPTQVRYSLGGGLVSDKSKSRGLALKMMGESGFWEMALTNTEINFATTIKEFGDFLAMRVPDSSGRADPKLIAKKTQETKAFANYDTYLQTLGVTPSVAHTAYHSNHTFYFTDAKSGKPIPARFTFMPLGGVKYLRQNELAAIGESFLEEDFTQRLNDAPLRYKMLLILANKHDKTDDTNALWRGKHTEIELGILEVSEYRGRDCNNDLFMPNILPNGVEAPKDPLFAVRNEVYAITFGMRQ